MWKLQHENQHIRYRSSPAGFEERSAQGPLRLRQQGENRRRDEFAKSSGLNMQERSDRFYSVNTPLNNHSALWPLRVGAKRRSRYRGPVKCLPRGIFFLFHWGLPCGMQSSFLWGEATSPGSYSTGAHFALRSALCSSRSALCYDPSDITLTKVVLEPPFHLWK